ncbi:hypothetical protein KP509_22G043200 [Ceratopteris richardii]|uniref:Uncharacterized protein n=2 Tax=Ceratopteris richardii TaxID=49495 RepID=A0A8T2S758_CERRI|nr:hypothetical protein KP509_22G043200 [Ceratopteris richardii]
MLKAAGLRAGRTLACRLHQSGFQRCSYSTPRQYVRPWSAAFSSNGLSNSFSRPRSIAQLYLQMLSKRPILTKSVTASTIYFFADVASQGIKAYQTEEHEEAQWDVARTLRMVAAGFFISGPTLHIWFNFVSRVVPARDLLSTLKKMAMGQLIYGPTFTVFFFSLNAFMQGESHQEIVARLRRDFIPTIRSGLMYWPICDFITYRYVPVHLQPLVSNSFSFLWTIYFTYMACSKKVEAVC